MDEFMERNYQKRQQHDALIRVSDLNYKLRLYGKRFIIFALLFYVCVPLFYYYLWLGWTAIDAFYFSFVTFSTVGYGDIIPHSIDQRMITCTLIIVGVGVTANIVGILAALHVEDLESSAAAGRASRCNKHVPRRSGIDVGVGGGGSVAGTGDEEGPGPKSSISSLTDSVGNPSMHAKDAHRTKREAAFPVVRAGLECIWSSPLGTVLRWMGALLDDLDVRARVVFDRVTCYYEPDLIVSPTMQAAAASASATSQQSPLNQALLNQDAAGPAATPISEKQHESAAEEFRHLSTPKLLTSRHVVAVNRIRRIIRSYYRELQDLRWTGCKDFVFLWAIILVGIFSMRAIEDFRPADSFYWAIVTVTTVGYGDVVPVTTAGKAFTIVYIMVGTVLMGRTLGNIVMSPMAMRAKKNEIAVMAQFELNLSEHQLHALLNNELFTSIPHFYQQSNQISKAEFMLNVLRMMSKVNDEDVLVAAEVTDRYCDGGATAGSVTIAELQAHILQARVEAEERRQRDREQLQREGALGDGGGRISFFDGVRDSMGVGAAGAVHSGMHQAQGHGRVTETEMRGSLAPGGGV